MDNWKKKVNSRLSFIYKNDIKDNQRDGIIRLINDNIPDLQEHKDLWDEKNVILITYGDSLLKKNKPPLQSLYEFLNEYLHNTITDVHILPFFPYSSDDGFSVIDFKQVNPDLGNWDDISQLASNYRLMVDLVINHASAKGEWFRNFLQSEGEGRDFFIVPPPGANLSKVVRPRSTPLLTAFNTARGKQKVWTTFSEDQVDLNFSNPDVLLAMLEVLIFYIKQGAKIIRLDAIAFLWKEYGTNCLHLPQTHEMVKLIRDVAELIDREVIILTETNVPNTENLSYFGQGDEAHMVYQFSLPPLLLQALFSGNSRYLNSWAKTIPQLPSNCTFFNFTASHDGIGVRPLEGLLPEEEKQLLFKSIEKSGGKISMKSNTDGSQSPYELNITYLDALKRTIDGPDKLQIERFLASQHIMLGMKGIPALYIHSILGSVNYKEGVDNTGRARTINREKLNIDEVKKELGTTGRRHTIFNNLRQAIHVRTSHPAFHPSGEQKITEIDHNFFAFERQFNGETIYCLTNLTPINQSVNLEIKYLSNLLNSSETGDFRKFKPYETKWLLKR